MIFNEFHLLYNTQFLLVCVVLCVCPCQRGLQSTLLGTARQLHNTELCVSALVLVSNQAMGVYSSC